MIAVLSAVYQTHQAVKQNQDDLHVEVERDVLKLWTILGVFIPFHFYFEAILSFVPLSGIIFFIPQIMFPLFYIWLSVPNLRASAYIFDQLQPIVAGRILPVVHSKLTVLFCILQRFFLGNFLTVIPRDELEELQEKVAATERDLQQKRRDTPQ